MAAASGSHGRRASLGPGALDPRFHAPPPCLDLAAQLASEVDAALKDENVHHYEIADIVSGLTEEDGSGRMPNNPDSLSISASENGSQGFSPRHLRLTSASIRLTSPSLSSQSSSWLGSSRTALSVRMSRASLGIGLRSQPTLTDNGDGSLHYVTHAMAGAEDLAKNGQPLPASTPSWARRAVVHNQKLTRHRGAASAEDVLSRPSEDVSKSESHVRRRQRSTMSLRLPKRRERAPRRCIEDVRDAAVLGAPVTDVCVCRRGKEPSGAHYYQVAKTVGGRRAYLNAGSWGKDAHLWIRKDPAWAEPALTGLTVILPEKGEFIPPGFSVMRQNGAPMDLNESTSGERVYLCKKTGVGNPIVDVQIVLLRKGETPPDGYSLMLKTPLDHPADVNTGSGGTAVYLCYKQVLLNLEPLKYQDLMPVKPPEGYLEALEAAGGSDEKARSFFADSSASGHRASLRSEPPLRLDDAELTSIRETGSGTTPSAGGVGSGGGAAAGDATPLELAFEDSASNYGVHPYADFHGAGDDALYTGVVDVFGTVEHLGKRNALRALLSSLYVRQGGVPDHALAALRRLLSQSDFFDSGVGDLPQVGWTLLDVTVDAVCDRFELMLEGSLEACTDFLGDAITKVDGVMNSWILQRLYKALYGCTIFHASRVHGWVRRAGVRPYREAAGTANKYQTKAFDGLKLLIHTVMLRVETAGEVNSIDEAQRSPTRTPAASMTDSEADALLSPAHIMVRDLLTDFLDKVLDHVELSRVINAILNIVMRQTANDAHWTELHVIASRIFNHAAHINMFVLLCALCKDAVAPLRRLVSGEIVARDLAIKLVALELLGELLRGAGDNCRSSNVFGYLVRRLVSTVVLQNAVYCMWDVRVLQAILTLTSALWDRFRRHMRLEMAVIADALLLPTLRVPAGSMIVSTDHQILVLREMVSWFENTPHNLVEFFLNFDMDASARNWNIFEGLCAALCGLAEVDVAMGGAADDDQEEERKLRRLQRSALDAVTQIARSLMDASGHAHLLKRDQRTRELSMKHRSGGWALEDTLVNEGDANAIRNALNRTPTGSSAKRTPPGSAQSGAMKSPKGGSLRSRLNSKAGNSSAAGESGARGVLSRSASSLVSALGGMISGSARLPGWESNGGDDAGSEGGDKDRADSAELTEHNLKKMMEAQEAKVASPKSSSAEAGRGHRSGSLRRLSQASAAGETVAVAGNGGGGHQLNGSRPSSGRAAPRRSSSVVMRQTAQKKNREQLAQALEIYRNTSLKKAIRYLVAVNFISDTPRDIASFLRLYAYELTEEDIGDYLGEGGATESDEKYYNLIRLSYVRPISFVGMPFEPALRHFLTSCGFKLPGEAQKVDRILSTFCLRYWADNQGTPVCPFMNSDTMFVVAFAVIMLNTDLHRANTGSKNRHRRMTKQDFQRNLRGVDDSADLNSEFLSAIYDSIAAQPIAMGVLDGGLGSPKARSGYGDPDSAANVSRAQQNFQKQLMRGLRRDEEMLAGLELNGAHNRFFRVGVDTSLSLDLLRLMFEATWFHFHGVVNYILEGEGRQDAEAVGTSLDILRYAVSISVFLNMDTVRTAFATQLAKFRYRFGATPGDDLSTYFIEGRHLQEPWFQDITSAPQEDAWDTIAKVHTLFIELKTDVQENDQRRELEQLARRIDGRAELLNGPRTFIREGDLVKVCRSGKKVTYRFFLFNDQLLYARQTLVRGTFKLHTQLPVSVMRVDDIPNSATSFQVNHPRKSFVVIAPSEDEKRIWMRVINDSIEAAVQKRDVEKRLSLGDRLVGQGIDEDSLPISVRSGERDDGFDEDGNVARAPPQTRLSIGSRLSSQGIAVEKLPVAVGGQLEGPMPPSPGITPPPMDVLGSSAANTPTGAITPEGRGGFFRAAKVPTSGPELKRLYRKAVKASTKMLEPGPVGPAASTNLTAEQKLEVYGLFKQAQHGDCPSDEAKSSAGKATADERKLDAWRRYAGLSTDDAKVAFVEKLDEVMPAWRLAAQGDVTPTGTPGANTPKYLG